MYLTCRSRGEGEAAKIHFFWDVAWYIQYLFPPPTPGRWRETKIHFFWDIAPWLTPSLVFPYAIIKVPSDQRAKRGPYPCMATHIVKYGIQYDIQFPVTLVHRCGSQIIFFAGVWDSKSWLEINRFCWNGMVVLEFCLGGGLRY